MGYFDRDNPDPDPTAVAPASGAGMLALTNGVLAILVRLTGIGLMAVGLWVGVEVVMEAWALYREPARIQVFASALEQGLNVDAMMAELMRPETGEAGAAAPREHSRLGVAFLLSWFIAPMLLFTVGYLAMSAVRTGGNLAMGVSRRG